MKKKQHTSTQHANPWGPWVCDVHFAVFLLFLATFHPCLLHMFKKICLSDPLSAMAYDILLNTVLRGCSTPHPSFLWSMLKKTSRIWNNMQPSSTRLSCLGLWAWSPWASWQQPSCIVRVAYGEMSSKLSGESFHGTAVAKEIHVPFLCCCNIGYLAAEHHLQQGLQVKCFNSQVFKGMTSHRKNSSPRSRRQPNILIQSGWSPKAA